MVMHNDKWKRKATREYHKKHGTLPAGRGRGRGRGGGIVDNEPVPGQVEEAEGDASTDDEASNTESGEADEDNETPRERSKYARRKIESNAWRFESEEPDPYLSTNRSESRALTEVINEEDLEPPEPDYAHLPARPFQTKKTVQNPNQLSGSGRGKKQSIKETELAPLKAQIDKANAARAFKERFAVGQKGNVLTVGEDGVARRQSRERPEEAEVDDEVDDIDSFLAELDLQKGISTYLFERTNE